MSSPGVFVSVNVSGVLGRQPVARADFGPSKARSKDLIEVFILAEAAAGQADYSFLVLPIGLGLLFYFLILMPQSREQSKKDAMLNSLKKNDRVTTIGGIIGTVAEVRQDEVVLKVDDNTRIHFQRKAIASVLTGENKEEAKSS